MHFEFFRFRFHFAAQDSVYFPPGKSGNIIRGAFGTIFRKIACVPGCRDAATCEISGSCPYARIFEPGAARGEGPSGLADWPRPFVFRASRLDGRTLRPGERFCFDVHIFDVGDPALAYFVLTFAQLAREGIGPQRGRALLVSVEQLNADESTAGQVFDGATFLVKQTPAPIILELDSAAERVNRVSVRFVTATELKTGHQVTGRPEFGVLFARVRDRLSTLRGLYGEGPLAIDFRGMGERAAGIKMTRCEMRRSEAERRSGRTGQVHSLGGFVGEAEYEGELGEFLPYLRAAKFTGVGRQTVWGKGEIEVADTTGLGAGEGG